MVAFLASLVVTGIMVLIVLRVAKRRAPGTPLTWGEAFIAATYVFTLLFIAYGVVPDRWLAWADSDLAWRSDVYGIPGIPGPGNKRFLEDGLSLGGRGRIMIPLQAIRDIVATVIYVVALVANVKMWVWWQKRGTAAAAAADEQLTSAYGRPLVKGS